MGKQYLIRKPTPFPGFKEVIEPAVPGEIIATWPGDRGGRIAYLIIIDSDEGEKLVAVTDSKFDPTKHPSIPLVCLVNMIPDDPEDWIEINDIGTNHVKGYIIC